MKTRPILYTETAYLYPRFCAFCGVTNRAWFVDLGLDIAVTYNAGNEGVIYICNECLPGVINDMISIDEAHAPIESTFDEFESFGSGRGPELPDVPTDAPGDEISAGVSDSGPVSELDSETDDPDDSSGDSAATSSGSDDSADGTDNQTELKERTGLIFDLS